jgi:hypothetical protein
MTTSTMASGWLGLGERITASLLSSPRFKARLDKVLGAVDPDSAPALVRSLLWTDPGVPLAMVGVVPLLLNAGAGAVAELLRQVASLPVEMTREVAADLWSRVDAADLGEAAHLATRRHLGMSPQEARFRLAVALLTVLLDALEQRLEQDPGAGDELARLLDDHPLVRERMSP